MVQPVVWRGRVTVNQTDTASDDHFDSRVVHLTNGNVLIAYVSTSTTGPASPAGYDIIGTIYDSLGNIVTSEIRLNVYSAADDEYDFEITAMADGGFAVAYFDNGISPDASQNIRFDRYNSVGTNIDSESVISDPDGAGTNPYYRNPHIASQSTASTLVTYEVYNDSGTGVELRGRLYDGTSFGTEIDMTGTYFTGVGESIDYSLAVLTSGAYVLAIANRNATGTNDQIEFLRLNTDGTPIGVQVPVYSDLAESYDPHVVGLTDGRFLITWVADGSGGTNTGIRAAIYNNDGTLDRAVWAPPTTVAGNQVNPVAAALPGGGYVIVWEDVDTMDIRGQAYNANGTANGGEFTVVDFGNSTVNDIDVEGLDDGRFIVSYEVNLNDAGDLTIERVIMDPRSAENSPNVYTTDQVIGTINADIIDVASTDDRVFGWDGDDRFDFNASTDISFGDEFDGGAGLDIISLRGGGTYDFRNATISSFSELEFAVNGDTLVRLDSSQINTGGLSATAVIDGTSGLGNEDTIEVYLTSQNNVDLSGWVITDWIIDDDLIIVSGNSNANVIRGSDTVDSMRGGEGNDTYYVNTFLDEVIEVAGFGTDTVYASASYTLTPGAEVETLAVEDSFGTASIVLVGNEFGQFLLGNDGDNTLAGGFGLDTFRGYLGNDIYVVDDIAEVVIELPGQGTDAVYTTVSYALGTGVSIERLVAAPLASTNQVNLVGNEIAQVVVGNNGVNYIYGLAGNDSLYGYGGNDVIRGDEGNDSLFGGTGLDQFVFREALGAASGIDRIYDLTAADTIVIDALAVATQAPITSNQFRLGTAALDADDRIIYDATSGAFWFDPDGTGAQAAILFGVIDGAPAGINYTYFDLA